MYISLQPGTPNKFTVKTSKSAKKLQMNQDEYYNYIYSGRKSNDNQQRNTNNNNNRESNTLNNKQCSPNIHLVKFDKEIEFGKALELLHNELYSFKLMDLDDDDNDNDNNNEQN